MTSPDDPRITFAERLNGGIIVHFSNGRSAIYSAALLLSILDQAEAVPEQEPEKL